MKRVTLREVAAATGLSVATVSHILSSNRSANFRPETCTLVTETAQRMGYRVSSAARTMRSGSTETVALLLSTISHRSQLAQELLVHLERGLSARHRHLLINTIAECDEANLPLTLQQHAADAFLINYTSDIPAIVLDTLDNYPTASVWLNCRRPHNCVFPDDIANGALITQHLIEHGHRAIAYVDCAQDLEQQPDHYHYSRTDRLAGYRQAMQAAGLPAQVHLGPPFSHHQHNRQWMRDHCFQQVGTTAFVCYGGNISERLASVAIEDQRMPGVDVHLATIDTEPVNRLGLPITTLVPNHRELARAALQMIDQAIADPHLKIPSIAIKGHIIPPAQ